MRTTFFSLRHCDMRRFLNPCTTAPLLQLKFSHHRISATARLNFSATAPHFGKNFPRAGKRKKNWAATATLHNCHTILQTCALKQWPSRTAESSSFTPPAASPLLRTFSACRKRGCYRVLRSGQLPRSGGPYLLAVSG